MGAEIVGRFDEAFELGRRLLAPLRGGWLEALRTDVDVERKLALTPAPERVSVLR